MTIFEDLIKKLSKFHFRFVGKMTFFYSDRRKNFYKNLIGDVIEVNNYKKPPDNFWTDQYETANSNLIRILVLFKELSKITYDPVSEIHLKFQIICETIIILVVSTLEVYLEDTFRDLANQLTLRDLNKTYVKKFLSKYYYKESESIFNQLNESLSLGEHIKTLLDEKRKYLYLQNRDKAKAAFKAIDFDLCKIDKVKWDKYVEYIKKRNEIIHTGSEIFKIKYLEDKELFTLEYVKKCIQNIAEYIFKIENARYKKYKNYFRSSSTPVKINIGKNS